MSRFLSPFIQLFDDAGDPLIDGLIHFYEPDSNTPKTTFADFALTIESPNPVVLSGAGRVPNVWFSGGARAILSTAAGVQIELRDNLGGDSSPTAFAEWVNVNEYNTPDLVLGSDGNFYLSITNGNTGNDPISSPADWTQIRFIRVWNASESYSIGHVAQAPDGLLYTSLTNNNLNNEPAATPLEWTPAVSASGGAAGPAPDMFSPLLLPITADEQLGGIQLYFDNDTQDQSNKFGPRYAWGESTPPGGSVDWKDIFTLTGPGVLQFLAVWPQAGTGGENFDLRITLDGNTILEIASAFLSSSGNEGYVLIGDIRWDSVNNVPLTLPYTLENLPFNAAVAVQVRGSTGSTNRTHKAIYRYYGAKPNPA